MDVDVDDTCVDYFPKVCGTFFRLLKHSDSI